VTAPHEHRFNATTIRHVGRCACGTFGKHYAGTWTVVTHPATAKGLETRLARAALATLPEYATELPRSHRGRKERSFERDDGSPRDLVSLFGPVERDERRRR